MKISAEKLQEIIESHGRWLRNAEGGERADLSGADHGNTGGTRHFHITNC